MNLYEILQNPDRVGEGMTHFERLFAQKVGDGKINEISGVPPLRYIGDGRPLTDCLISGNTVQDGTPTPENPVPVVGCGTDTEDGFKLPITVNGTEYPIYLGTVPTTRRIGKFDLSELSWTRISNGLWKTTGIPNIKYVSANTEVGDGIAEKYAIHAGAGMSTAPGYIAIDVSQVSVNTGDASETPTGMFWYVLAELETAVVNEPLMKIGDYADTVSAAQAGVTIPTVNGANILDVPTTVPPSEVLIRGRIKEA